MAWWLLATALEHIPQGNCITIGESEKGSEERVSDMKKREKELLKWIVYVKNKSIICLSSQHCLIWFLDIQKIVCG